MKRVTLSLSEAAAADIVEQADWYQEQSGPVLAKRWEKGRPPCCKSSIILPLAPGRFVDSLMLSSVRYGEFRLQDFPSI